MFWDSVVGGLTVLTHWQTYAAAALFVAISVGPLFLVASIVKSNRAMMAAGCLTSLVMPFFSAFALIVFVFTMCPIILGLSNDAAWELPWAIAMHDPWLVAKFMGALLFGTLALAFIPIIGRLQTLHTLLLGSVVLVISFGVIGNAIPAIGAKSVHFWPGFWFVAGLMVVGSILTWLGVLVAAFVAMAVDSKFEGMGQLAGQPIAAIGGFVPLFIYGAWLGAQIRA